MSRSVARKRLAYLLSAVPLLGGCVGEDVSAGAVGSSINAARCNGVDCTANPGTTLLPDAEPVRCAGAAEGGLGAAGFSLVEDLRVEATDGALMELALAPDGSIWTLHVSLDSEETWVEHHDSAGAPMAASSRIPSLGIPESHLAVDAQGRAWVAIYNSIAGPTADDDFQERTILAGYNADGAPVRESLVVGSLAGAMIAVGPGDELTLAGSWAQNGHGGSIIRFDAAGEPAWIQTQVRTDGFGVGVGVSGLVAHPNGTVHVLSERARDFSSDRASFGIARFGADGTLLADGAIRRLFLAGNDVSLLADPDGNLVTIGPTAWEPVGDSGAAYELGVAQSYPADGSTGFAYEMRAPVASSATIDPASGDLFVMTTDGVAVVPRSGESCLIAAAPPDAFGNPRGLRELDYAGGALYYAEQWGFGRWRIVE